MNLVCSDSDLIIDWLLTVDMIIVAVRKQIQLASKPTMIQPKNLL
jgi:hypothetical protein